MRSAAQRLANFYSRFEDVKWDLIIKVFNDFSTIFFKGDLHRRVYLSWIEYQTHPFLSHTSPGIKFGAIGNTLGQRTSGMNRICIGMRADFNWAKLPKLDPLTVLLHEMLHAYFRTHCGENCKEVPTAASPDPSHGTIWKKALAHLQAKGNLKASLTTWHEDLLEKDSYSPFF
ncbi:hypothetical protein Slin14017_G109190 [Septoria linicola]|nr:hypothetical protein Slin14017_G109190 [Septoria linicola]